MSPHYQTPDGKTVEVLPDAIVSGGRRVNVRHPELGVISVELAKLTEVDPPEPGYGDLVAVRCSATGRYLIDGLALVVSAMDSSLFLDDVDLSRDPAPTSALPHDWALSGALAVMTSGKYERKAKGRPVQ